MKTTVLLAAGLAAVRHASAAYDATICGRENKYTSEDTQFICTLCPSVVHCLSGDAIIAGIHVSGPRLRVVGLEANSRNLQFSPTPGTPLVMVPRVSR